MSSETNEAALAERQIRDIERLRGDLLTVGRRISHDLRSPLNGMYTAIQALRDLPASAGLESSQAKLVGSLAESVQELEALVDRVSFVVKATAEPPPAERVSMKDVVWKSLLRLEHRLKDKGVTVVQPVSWPHVAGTSAWLEVVWWNLIANSLRHGGKAPRIELGWKREDGMCCFWICDDGAGVSEAKLPQLFHPLELMHELNAPRGIGLPIVRRLVELQGGTCGYELRPGGGACFFFTAVPAA